MPTGPETILRDYERWVRARVALRSPQLDPDDIESFAREALWIAARECIAPEAIGAYADTVLRRMVANQLRSSDRPRVTHLESWADIAACSIRFPEADNEAPACLECGTTGGYVPPSQLRPRRIKGLCNECDTRRRRVRADVA